MSHFVPKHEMTEEDIKLQFITPAIMAKWPTNRITMETKITDGSRPQVVSCSATCR